MSLIVTDNITVDKKVVNIDNHYGPYTDKNDVINNLVNDGSNMMATNGLTVGIWGDAEHKSVEEYVFVNITDNTLPTIDNLVRKVGTLTIRLNGQEYVCNLNNGDATIEIQGISWNDITDKPDFSNVAYFV